MTWEAVARKDFQDSIRSWWLWGLSALFVVFYTVPAYFFYREIGRTVVEQGEEIASTAFIDVMASINAFFIPIIAIVIAYAAIAGERDSGTLKLLLSLPHSRRDVVLGKVIGRSAVIVIPAILGLGASAIVFVLTPVTFEAGEYAAFTLLSAVLGVIFVAIAVGISAAARTSRRAMIGTVGVYVLFTLFWGRFASGIARLANEYTSASTETVVQLQLFVLLINPSEAYQSLSAALWTDETLFARASAFGGGGFQSQLYAQVLEPLPAYFSNPAVVVLFLVWLVVPPVLGYLAFREDDL